MSKLINSSLFRAAGIYTAARVINRSIPFFLLPILTRYLTPKDYGIIAMFNVLLGIVGAFIGLGAINALTRYYFDKDTIDLPNYITNSLYILFVSSVIIGLILWAFSDWIHYYAKFPIDWIWAIFVVSICQYLIKIPLILWQVQIRPFAFGTFQIMQTLTIMSLAIILVVVLNMNWKGRIVSQVFACALFGLLALFFLWKDGWLKQGYNSEYVRSGLQFGIPLIPHTFGGLIISMTDRVLITNMIGIAETGIYVVGVQIGMIIGLIQESFNKAWVPWLFGQLKKKDIRMNLRIVKFTYLYNICIFVMALLFAAIAPWILSFFVGKEFVGASQYVIWIALGYAFGGMYKMVTNYIFFVEKTYLLAWATFFTAVMNIIISYVLIRLNGAIGAAQGTMLSYLLSFLLTWIVSARVYKMPWILNQEEQD